MVYPDDEDLEWSIAVLTRRGGLGGYDVEQLDPVTGSCPGCVTVLSAWKAADLGNTGHYRVAYKVTAADVATLSESTPCIIGIVTRRSSSRSVSGVSPCPSVPKTSARF